MSDQISSCPTQEELRKCVYNQLSANEIEALKSHVKMCPKCRVSFTAILKETPNATVELLIKKALKNL